jgi:hypothetical protein
VARLLGGFWVYYAWSGVPAIMRGNITPAGAVGRLFVPFYNLYWSFAVNTLLCDHIDRVLAQKLRRIRTPKSLAIVAAAVNLTPVLITVMKQSQYAFYATLAACGLWLAYMFACDRARREFAEIVATWPADARRT